MDHNENPTIADHIVDNKSTNRNICFTSFKLDAFDPANIKYKFDNQTTKTKMTFLTFQMEECTTTNKIHIQGYFEMSAGARRSAFVKFFEDEYLWCARRKGSREQAIHYCQCDINDCATNCENPYRFRKIRRAGPFTYGEMTESRKVQGQRTDLEAVQNYLKQGHSLHETAKQFPSQYIKYERGIVKYYIAMHNVTFRTTKPEVIVVIGANLEVAHRYAHGYILSEENKTRDASNKILPKDIENLIYNWTPESRRATYFDGYDPVKHSTIFIQNYFNEIEFPLLFNMLGSERMNLPIRFETVPMVAKRIIITSEKSPLHWYRNSGRNELAIFSRIDKIVKIGDNCDIKYLDSDLNSVKRLYSNGLNTANAITGEYDTSTTLFKDGRSRFGQRLQIDISDIPSSLQ
jgi:hypothetical protein